MRTGLLDDVNCPMTTGLPRQYAAQIMYNMIDAETVRSSTDSDSYNNYSDNGTKYETVGKKYMEREQGCCYHDRLLQDFR